MNRSYPEADNMTTGKVCEPAFALADVIYNEPRQRRVVSLKDLKEHGYMTLDESKAIISKKIHDHYHKVHLGQLVLRPGKVE